jgi:hypothetical protein
MELWIVVVLVKIKTKGYLYVGSQKTPKPMLTKKELLGKTKAILRNPKVWAGTPNLKKENEVWW